MSGQRIYNMFLTVLMVELASAQAAAIKTKSVVLQAHH